MSRVISRAPRHGTPQWGAPGRRPSRHRTPRHRVVGLAVVAVLVVGALTVGTVALVNGVSGWFGPRPPGIGTTVVTAAQSKAARAADDETSTGAQRDAAAYLASQPTVTWLTPENDPVDEIWDRVADLAAQARAQSAVLAVAVYGLPGRDCGQFSEGGLSEPDYEEWTEGIGTALRNARDLQRIVVLEPDSLALAPECGNVEERTRQLRGAIDRIAGTDIWIYVDGGHSNWLPASQMAGLIAGLDRADALRGFTTNVSNYNDSVDEFDYAHEVAGALGGSHALVDTSRNGNGAEAAVWCNPTGRRIGVAGGTLGDEVVDTNLWIKPPGESDGTCNGGPPAGQWWPASALELTTDAR